MFEFLKNNARFDETTHDFITNLFYDRSEIDEIVNTLKRMFQVIQSVKTEASQSFKNEASQSVKNEDIQDEAMEAQPCKKRKCDVLPPEEIKKVKTENVQEMMMVEEMFSMTEK
jgi:hypothetical protein